MLKWKNNALRHSCEIDRLNMDGSIPVPKPQMNLRCHTHSKLNSFRIVDCFSNFSLNIKNPKRSTPRKLTLK